jgi:hypothetical protein
MAYRSHTTKIENGLSTITINKPSGTVEGDILLLLVSLDRTTAETITPPSGFAALASSPLNSAVEAGSSACFWKKAGASEPASYDWTCTSSASTAGILAAYSGRDGTTPINASSGLAEGGAASAASVNATGITPSVDNCDIVYLAATDTTVSATVSWTPPSGMTERAEVTTASPWVNATLADLTQGTAASTGTVTGTATWTGGGTTGRMAFLVALAPAAGSSAKPAYYFAQL